MLDGSPEHQVDQQHRPESLGSLDRRNPTTPNHQLSTGVSRSTTSASPGMAPAAFELHLRDKLNNKTDGRKEEIHTLTTMGQQPWTNSAAEPAGVIHEGRKPQATSTAFVCTAKPASDFFIFNVGLLTVRPRRRH